LRKGADGGIEGTGKTFMKTVAIIGMGLMGGSLGMALRRKGLARVKGYARREETRRQALDVGAVDEVCEAPGDAVKGASIVVMCTPVLTIPALVNECRNGFGAGTVVTDVGSTKAEVVNRVVSILAGSDVHFVGSHPMAGSEKSGIEVARMDLYEGAVTAVTPVQGEVDSVVGAVSGLWSSVGSRVIRISPEEHDALVARTSHLPHLVASLLVTTAVGEGGERFRALCGPGFRDATRIAGGSPEMWHDIVKTNRAAILEVLRDYQGELGALIATIEAGDFEGIREQLDRGRRLRDRILS
jgi:prephenate dehydrogenase